MENSHKDIISLWISDGVFVDFVKLAAQVVPGWEDDSNPNRDKKLDRMLWTTIARMANEGKPFWGRMEPMPDAIQLWNYVKKYNPEILSATGHVGNPVPEKKEWVRSHLDPNVHVNLVRKASDKAQFAAPNHILIDDKLKAINPWIAAGGIGILHKSAADTIKQLQKIGL